MAETHVTLVGNLTADPELRFTPSGLQVANLRIAVTPRSRQDDGSWTDGETSFHTVNVWRDQAEHAAETPGPRRSLVMRHMSGSLVTALRPPDRRRSSVHRCAAARIGPDESGRIERTPGPWPRP